MASRENSAPRFRFARRMKNFEASGIRKVFDRAQKMGDAIDLSIGQPDYDVPEPVKAAAIEAIRKGFNRYTVTQGIPELHELVRGQVRVRTGVEPDGVLITSGTAGAILTCLMVLVEEGVEVLIPDPYFVIYKNLVNLAGGTPRTVDTYPDFRLTPEKVRAAVTPRTRILIFNNPVNPTGIAYRPEEVRAIAAVAREHGLLVLSDEIYELFQYDFPFESVLKHDPGAVVVNGFSKTFGMPGWRLGWAVGPRELIDQMTMLQQFSYVCAPAPAQRAVLAAPQCDLEGYRASYRHKRDLVYAGLKDCYDLVRPEGSFYAFPAAPGGDATAFVERAIEKRVLVVPGDAFSLRNTHFRISYAVSDAALARGIEVLQELAS